MYFFKINPFQKISLILILLLKIPSTAELLRMEEKWNGGWVFIGALGVTGARTVSNTNSQRAMIGPNVSTSVGYCENQSYCIEVGSITSANFYDRIEKRTQGRDVIASLVMWETSYFLSTRVKIPVIQPTDLFNPAFKLLGGYGNSVSFIRDIDDADISSREDLRIHNEGPLMGYSVMFFFNAYNDSIPWFIEITTILQMHWKSYFVEPEGVVPVISEKGYTEENLRVTRLNINVGMIIF